MGKYLFWKKIRYGNLRKVKLVSILFLRLELELRRISIMFFLDDDDDIYDEVFDVCLVFFY